MPAFDDDNDPLVPKLPPSVNEKDLTYQGIANDTQITRIETLMTKVPGSRWIPEAVYTQILATDDAETRPLQPSGLEINQQYNRILNMELKVTSAIPQTPQLDEDSQEFSPKGSANVYPNTWVPKKDDHIVAIAPDGRRGLYQIIGKPVTLSIFIKPAYTIEFILSRWLTADDQRNLQRRTAETYVYVRDRVGSGLNPLITSDEHQKLEDLNSWQARIPEMYLTWYFNKEYATLTIPNQPCPTYDPFHAYFIQALFGSRISGTMPGLQHIPVMDGAEHGYQTIWDLLLSLDPHRIDTLTVRIPIINVESFIRNPYMRSVRYSGMRRVVYPMDADRDGFMGWTPGNYVVSPLSPGVKPPVKIRKTLVQLFPDYHLGTPFDVVPTSSDIKLVTYDDCYVLSEDFYAHNAANLSKLEKVIWDALLTGVVFSEDIASLIKASEHWSDVEKFYYLPILYALIPSAQRGLG